MPEPITSAAAPAPSPVQRHRVGTRTPLARRLRNQDWRTLVGTYRLLSRLVMERSKHHRADDADALAHQARIVERELEDVFPLRWSRRRPGLLLEQAAWWREMHGADVLSCRMCHLQAGGIPERIDMPGLA